MMHAGLSQHIPLVEVDILYVKRSTWLASLAMLELARLGATATMCEAFAFWVILSLALAGLLWVTRGASTTDRWRFMAVVTLGLSIATLTEAFAGSCVHLLPPHGDAASSAPTASTTARPTASPTRAGNGTV